MRRQQSPRWQAPWRDTDHVSCDSCGRSCAASALRLVLEHGGPARICADCDRSEFPQLSLDGEAERA